MTAQSRHRRTGTLGLGEGGEGRKNLHNSRIRDCWNPLSGYKLTQIARKRNSFSIYHVAGNFSWEFNFADFGSFRPVSQEKNREFGFQTLLVEIPFRGFHVQYLIGAKIEAIWSFSLHCFQPISLKFSNVKKGVNFCWVFVGGSLF